MKSRLSWRIHPEKECNPGAIADDSVHGYLTLLLLTLGLGVLRSVLVYYDSGGHFLPWWFDMLTFMSAIWAIYTIAAICLRSRDAIFAATCYLVYVAVTNIASFILGVLGLLPATSFDPLTFLNLLLSTVWLIYLNRSEVIAARFPEPSRHIFVADWIGMTITLILPVIAMMTMPLLIVLFSRPADNFNPDTQQVSEYVKAFKVANMPEGASFRAYKGVVSEIDYDSCNNVITIRQDLSWGEKADTGDDLYAASMALFSPAFDLYKNLRAQRPTFRFILSEAKTGHTREVIMDPDRYEDLHRRLFDTNHSVAYTERLDRVMPINTGSGQLWEVNFDRQTVTTEFYIKNAATTDSIKLARLIFDRFPSILYHLNEYGNDLLINHIDSEGNLVRQSRLNRQQLRETAENLGVSSRMIPEGLNRSIRDFNNYLPRIKRHSPISFGMTPRNRRIEQTYLINDFSEQPFDPATQGLTRLRDRLNKEFTDMIDYSDILAKYHLGLSLRFCGSESGRIYEISLSPDEIDSILSDRR